MAYKRVAAVTGANKGIGLAIGTAQAISNMRAPTYFLLIRVRLPVRNLALQYPRSALNDGPLLVYLTARDRGRGEAALQRLQTDRQLQSAKALAQDGGLTDVQYHQLDISDGGSIASFCDFLKKEHPEGIDVLVNNAGVALDGFG
jgi:carbonyl reductase 1